MRMRWEKHVADAGERGEMHGGCSGGGIDILEDLDVDMKITLKCISKEIGWDFVVYIHLFAQCS